MIAIIQGCGANVGSVQHAITRLAKKCVLTRDEKIIRAASHVILPGVGTAHQAIQQLNQLKLIDVIKTLQQPVLGICLGMQLLYQFSEEGHVDCLGIIPGKITSLKKDPQSIVPHMGWNRFNITQQQSPLFKGINNGSYVYYVHSYAAPISQHTMATTQYGENFTAIVQSSNFFGMQFHPERSSTIGERILKNFLEL